MSAESSKKEPDKMDWIEHLTDILQTEEKVIAEVQQCILGSVDDFVNYDTGIEQLYQIAICYSQCLKSLGLTSYEELQSCLTSQSTSNEEISRIHEEILAKEKLLDDILQDIDERLKRETGPVVELDDLGPVDVPLVNVRTQETVNLRTYLSPPTSSLVILPIRHYI